MSNPATDQPFDYDLTEQVRSQGAPAVQRYRVDDMINIVTVPSTGGRGLMGLDRTLLGRGADDDLVPISGYTSQVKVEGASGSQVSYRTHLMGTRDYAVDRTAAAQSRENKRLKAAKRAHQDAARGLFRMVSGLFVAGNFSGRTAALAAVSGGDGKNLSDPTCDIVRNLRAAKRAFRSGNDSLTPNRFIMSRQDLETIAETNTTFRASIRDTADGYSNTEAARLLLKALLECDIVVKDAPSAGTNLWTNKFAFVCVDSAAPIEPYSSEGASPAWTFPGLGMKEADGGDIEFEELTTAALVLQEFDPSVIEVQTSGNPQTWAVASFMERYSELLSVALAPAVNIVDANAGYLVTATNG